MLGLIEHKTDLYTLLYYVDEIPLITMVAGVIISTPVFSNLIEKSSKKTVTLYLYNAMLLGILIISTSYIASSTYNPFIYCRF